MINETYAKPSPLFGYLGAAHGKFVFSRRVRALAATIADILPKSAEVVDIGCGDGSLSALVMRQRPDVRIGGFEIGKRPMCDIPVQEFDGARLPLKDRAVDVAMFVDVLHHTKDPIQLLREASRIARKCVIIKDHRTERRGAQAILRIMDWVGNRPHGVVLPYNYWSERQWREAWDALGLKPDYFQSHLELYPWPARFVFETGLHFVARLIVTN